MKKIFVLALSVLSITVFAQTPTGKIVVKKGQHFSVETKTDGAIKNEIMGQPMEMAITNTAKIDAAIKDSKDNKYTITQTITNIKSSFSGMGQDKSFDSDKKEDMDGEAGKIYKEKLNVPTEIVITNEGKSVAVANTDTTKKEDDANPMAAMMNIMGGSGDNAAAAIFLVIPAGKKAGDTWQDSTSVDGVTLNKTYTLNSISNKEASVTINGVLGINKQMDVQGMEMTMAVTSKISSAVLVDVASSIQKENKSVMDVSGTVDIMGQSMPLTATVNTLTTVKAL